MTGAARVREWLERVHGRLHDELLAAGLPVLVIGVLAAGAVMHGASYVPMVDVHLALAADPMAPWHSLGKNGYLLDSPTLLLLAHALGVETRLAFAALAFAITGLGLMWLVWLANRHYGDEAARLVAISFFIAPIGAVVITWLGQPDPITLVAAGTLVLARSAPMFAVAGVALGFNHFEAGVAIVIASCLLRIAEAPTPTRSRALDALLAIAGLVAGKLVLSWWQATNGQDPSSRLDYVFQVGFHRYVISSLGNLPALVFSTFSLAWPLVAVAFVEKWYAQRRIASAMLLAGLVAAGVTLLVLDPTRVFALVSWPLVLFVVTRMPDLRLAVWCVLAGVLIPRLIVWDGGVIASGFHRLLISAFSAV